jgi:hypothetical protein
MSTIQEALNELKEPHSINEGAMAALDIEINDAGGKLIFISQIKKEIKEIEDFLNSDALKSKLVNGGGNFDNEEERQEVVKDIENQLSDLRNKLAIVNT